ncbi:MAG: adenine deaminase [Bacilli bacterium]|nr:adenine deaminase [Bacilli bacterium]
MLEYGQFWRNKDLREHVAVIDQKIPPTIVLTNGIYLDVYTKKWRKGNIWIYKDRIIYVGEELPEQKEGTEIVDCTGQYIVPGYIEPHAHPYQLYNPESFAYFAAKTGTTTLINDNLRIFSMLDLEDSFSLIEELHKLPTSMFWWARYDSQTMLRDDEEKFDTDTVLSWINNPSVIQGGELTSWPQLLQGDDRLLYWIQETKRKRKRVEGHLPGASEKTLTKLKLLGASADHEPMTGEEVLNRLRLGYHVPLRYSSIRPDLPKLLDEILELELDVFDQLTYTTDGSSPVFMEKGVINLCIDIAIKKGIPLIDAYRMATYNVAKYYGLDEVIGSIAPGRLAHLNILYEQDDPTPLSVIAKGQWIVKEGIECKPTVNIDWKKYGIDKLKLDWDLTDDDLQFSIPVGMEMMNDVILKPYPIEIDITVSNISSDNFDAFLLLIDRDGKWRVNTMLKGFVKSLGGLCSTFSTTDDIIIIGKRKADMRLAFERTKEIGGGIVLAHEGKIIYELPLALSGAMSTEDLETLISQVNGLIDTLKRYGYELSDPMYNLFFLSSMHLPYIRVTPKGIIDVMKRETIVPANMR